MKVSNVVQDYICMSRGSNEQSSNVSLFEKNMFEVIANIKKLTKQNKTDQSQLRRTKTFSSSIYAERSKISR